MGLGTNISKSGSSQCGVHSLPENTGRHQLTDQRQDRSIYDVMGDSLSSLNEGK